MTISVTGLNHKSASIGIREKFSFNGDTSSLLLRRIKKLPEINEVIIVSTCNRTEIYVDSINGVSDVKDWLLSEKEFQSFVNHMYSHQ